MRLRRLISCGKRKKRGSPIEAILLLGEMEGGEKMFLFYFEIRNPFIETIQGEIFANSKEEAYSTLLERYSKRLGIPKPNLMVANLTEVA